MKKSKIISVLLVFVIFVGLFIMPAYADEDDVYNAVTVSKIIEKTNVFALKAKSHMLMDAGSGAIMLEGNAHEKLPIASVTKIMTMLLVMEAVDSGRFKLDDKVTVSDHAVSMGGSQVYLKQGETFTVTELLKAVAIHSANDATVALGEKVSGSEETFVAEMNKRALELGMNNTHFIDCSGLTDDGQYSTAYDVSLMSRELITKHPKIMEYSSIWMDTFRSGTFGLNNRNKLVHFYEGCNGLKTGFTNKAGHCISATAKKNGMLLIAVVLNEPDSNTRFAEARKLLDYGFANYESVKVNLKGDEAGTAEIKKGLRTNIKGIVDSDVSVLVKKGEKDKIKRIVTMFDDITAPVKEGQPVGAIEYMVSEKLVGRVDIVADTHVEKASVMNLFFRMIVEWAGFGKVMAIK